MKFNRDMRVDPEFVAAHRDIRPLLVNEAVERWFWRYDKAAVLWKKIYELVGTLSLVCVTFATLYLGYRVTLGATYGALPELDAAGTVLGAVGFFAQLTLVFGKLRDRWLLARFAAERMRCLKYQSFSVLWDAQRSYGLDQAITAYAEVAIAEVRQELRAGRSAIGAFNPTVALPEWAAHREGDEEVLRQAVRAYDKLRIGVQIEHFDDRIAFAKKNRQSPSAVADWFFVIASLFTLFELALNGVHLVLPDINVPEVSPALQPWWWFAVWTLFVGSAVLAIYGQARVQEVDADRYEQYQREMHEIRKLRADDWPSFAARVHAMELVAFRELQDFCRDQKYFGYLF